MKMLFVVLPVIRLVLSSFAQGPGNERQQFIRVNSKIVVLKNVRIIDGTGTAPLGKQADMMIVKGNPAANISDINNVEIDFKNGVGWDSEKLIQSVQGLVGIR